MMNALSDTLKALKPDDLLTTQVVVVLPAAAWLDLPYKTRHDIGDLASVVGTQGQRPGVDEVVWKNRYGQLAEPLKDALARAKQ